jgi:hypothetical protein
MFHPHRPLATGAREPMLAPEIVHFCILHGSLDETTASAPGSPVRATASQASADRARQP